MQDLTFGEQVKIILGRKGMTIKQLAELIEEKTGKKMSRQNLTQRLGRDNFQEQDMRMIAEMLECPFHLSIMSAEGAGEVRSIAALERAAADAQQRHDLLVAQPHVRSVSLFRPLAVTDITRDTVYFFHQLFISDAFHRDDFHNLCFLFPKQRCRFATACFHVPITTRERFSESCSDTKKPKSAKRTPQAARKPET